MRPLLITILALATTASAQTPFAALHQLIGDWDAHFPSGSVVHVNNRVISSDSAIVESYSIIGDKRPNADTLTIYHPDGADLIATHYCGQGNQPRLRLDPASTPTDLRFTFKDATNLASPAASHLTRLRIQIIDANHYDKTETYTENGKDDTTVYHFVRLPAKPN